MLTSCSTDHLSLLLNWVNGTSCSKFFKRTLPFSITRELDRLLHRFRSLMVPPDNRLHRLCLAHIRCYLFIYPENPWARTCLTWLPTTNPLENEKKMMFQPCLFVGGSQNMPGQLEVDSHWFTPPNQVLLISTNKLAVRHAKPSQNGNLNWVGCLPEKKTDFFKLMKWRPSLLAYQYLTKRFKNLLLSQMSLKQH